jgi:hypothetical protein
MSILSFHLHLEGYLLLYRIPGSKEKISWRENPTFSEVACPGLQCRRQEKSSDPKIIFQLKLSYVISTTIHVLAQL